MSQYEYAADPGMEGSQGTSDLVPRDQVVNVLRNLNVSLPHKTLTPV